MRFCKSSICLVSGEERKFHRLNHEPLVSAREEQVLSGPSNGSARRETEIAEQKPRGLERSTSREKLSTSRGKLEGDWARLVVQLLRCAVLAQGDSKGACEEFQY
jgi:hypothetical protein